MKLNIGQVRDKTASSLLFEFEADLSSLSFYGHTPVVEPVSISGEVTNSADVVFLRMVISTNLHLICDRCLKPYQREKREELKAVVVTGLEDESENHDILIAPDDILDLLEIATDALILSMEAKNLCGEACAGLCPGCGIDLNISQCECRPEGDPRLKILSALLDR